MISETGEQWQFFAAREDVYGIDLDQTNSFKYLANMSTIDATSRPRIGESLRRENDAASAIKGNRRNRWHKRTLPECCARTSRRATSFAEVLVCRYSKPVRSCENSSVTVASVVVASVVVASLVAASFALVRLSLHRLPWFACSCIPCRCIGCRWIVCRCIACRCIGCRWHNARSN
jgi:hypothetical protein